MRKIIEFNTGWLFSRTYNGDENSFENSSAEAVFPIYDNSPDSHYILRGTFSLPGECSGSRVYLSLISLNGECELYSDKKRCGTGCSAGANVYFDVTDNVAAGEKNTFTVLASAYAGNFAVEGIQLLILGKSHFYPADGTASGITVRAEKTGDEVWLHFNQKVENPINYDIASYIVTDSSGTVIGSAASKPSQRDVTTQLSNAPLWNGPHDTACVMLTASILRDSAVLDMVQQSFGIRFPEIRQDGFFYLNSVRMPLSGMSLSSAECKKIPVASLMELANELGANAFRLSAGPHSLALIEACDRNGFAVWLDIGENVTGEALITCIRQYSAHPSVLSVCINAPEPGVTREEIQTECSGIIPVFVKDGEFISISDASAAASAAEKISPSSPAAVCVSGISAEDHEKIWAQLCSKAGLFAFFAEGLISYEGVTPGISVCEPTDAFYLYKSCFSAVPFVKIIPCEPEGRYADIRCCSNEAFLSLSVNGRQRKKYTGTLTKGGLVVFNSVFLPSKENIVKITGENSSDETEIIATRKK